MTDLDIYRQVLAERLVAAGRCRSLRNILLVIDARVIGLGDDFSIESVCNAINQIRDWIDTFERTLRENKDEPT